MKWALWVLATGLLPSVALANSVVVKSGEHETFSRLVFYHEDEEVSQLSQKEGTVVFMLSNSISEVDSSSVFDFIPAQRVLDVTLNDGRLEIELGCECSIDFVRYAGGVSYLDVKDFPVDAGETLGFKGSEGTWSSSELYRYNPAPDFSRLDNLVVNASPSAVKEKSLLLNLSPLMRGGNLKVSQWLEEGQFAESENQVRTFSEGGAVDEIRFRPPSRYMDGFLLDVKSLGVNLFPIDYINSTNGSGLQEAQGGSVCRSSLSKDLFDFSVSKLDFESDLPAARSSMLNSNFQMNGHSASDLVRLYISMGMMAEAKFFIDFVEPSQDRAALNLIISFIAALDHDDFLDFLDFSGFKCVKGGLFWSAMMGELIVINSEVLVDIITYFRSFSSGLRDLTFSRFEEILDEFGAGRGVSLLDFDGRSFTYSKESERGRVNFSTEKSMSQTRRKVPTTSIERGEFDSGEKYSALKGYSIDRVMWDGIAHSLRGSEMQVSAWVKLLDSHLNVYNWVAGAEVIASAARGGQLSIARQLLDERFFPQLLERGSVGDVLLFYQEDRFDFLVGLLSVENRKLLKNRIIVSLPDAWDSNGAMGGSVVESIEGKKFVDNGLSSLSLQPPEIPLSSDGLVPGDFSRLLSESQILIREVETILGSMVAKR